MGKTTEEALAEKLRELDLLERTVKRLYRLGAYTQEQQLLALAKEIEYYRQHIEWYRNYIDGFPQAKPRQIVAVKVKKKRNPLLEVKTSEPAIRTRWRNF
jgi:hypothetical protein